MTTQDEAVGDQGEHGGGRQADLRPGVFRADPEYRPRHEHDQHQREYDLPEVISGAAARLEAQECARPGDIAQDVDRIRLQIPCADTPAGFASGARRWTLLRHG